MQLNQKQQHDFGKFIYHLKHDKLTFNEVEPVIEILTAAGWNLSPDLFNHLSKKKRLKFSDLTLLIPAIENVVPEDKSDLMLANYEKSLTQN